MKNDSKPKLCELCGTELSKYRCPKCKILYCSVACFKSHKEKQCQLLTDQSNEKEKENHQILHGHSYKEEWEMSDNSLDEEDTEDKVPVEKLQRLGESHEVRQMLENPHLRSLMIGLVESKDPGHTIEAAMQEPIFLELADECLDLIKDENALPKG